MKEGSKVKAVANFKIVAATYPMFQYPQRGDILTVATVTSHPNKKMRQIGAVMLTFEELDNHGIASKQIDGKPNFIEIKPNELWIEEAQVKYKKQLQLEHERFWSITSPVI